MKKQGKGEQERRAFIFQHMHCNQLREGHRRIAGGLLLKSGIKKSKIVNYIHIRMHKMFY